MLFIAERVHVMAPVVKKDLEPIFQANDCDDTRDDCQNDVDDWFHYANPWLYGGLSLYDFARAMSEKEFQSVALALVCSTC